MFIFLNLGNSTGWATKWENIWEILKLEVVGGNPFRFAQEFFRGFNQSGHMGKKKKKKTIGKTHPCILQDSTQHSYFTQENHCQWNVLNQTSAPWWRTHLYSPLRRRCQMGEEEALRGPLVANTSFRISCLAGGFFTSWITREALWHLQGL